MSNNITLGLTSRPVSVDFSIEVCIVAYDNAATVGTCIASLANIAGRVGVAVHDNNPRFSSVPSARDAATAIGADFRAQTCEANCGFATGCNALAKESGADYLLFLNPDANICAWDATMTDGPGIFGAYLKDTNGTILHRHGVGARSLTDEFRLRLLRHRPPPPAGFGYVSGAALLIRRTDFWALGGFDERYFMYYEDIDLCVRAGRSGMPVAASPRFLVEHIGGYSAARNMGRALILSYESARYFHIKERHDPVVLEALLGIDAVLRWFWSLFANGAGSPKEAGYRALLRHIALRIRKAARHLAARE